MWLESMQAFTVQASRGSSNEPGEGNLVLENEFTQSLNKISVKD